jgi:hypothetical protein
MTKISTKDQEFKNVAFFVRSGKEHPMKTKECPSCGWEVEADCKECKYCQYEFPQTNKVYVLIAIILIVVFVVLMF